MSGYLLDWLKAAGWIFVACCKLFKLGSPSTAKPWSTLMCIK